MLEAIELCERIAGRRAELDAERTRRAIGDHRWWISDLGGVRRDYPDWSLKRDLEAILREIHDANVERWARPAA